MTKTITAIKYRIYYKNLKDITTEERKILNSLTLRSSGMRDDVLSKRANLHKYETFLAKESGKIIGWATLFPENTIFGCGDSTSWISYVYVRYSHRRHGVGTRLLKRVLKMAKKIQAKVKVFSWDDRSDKFFETRNLNIEIKYDH